MRSLQGIETNMLAEFIRLCEAHDLRYYVAYGSLLGAVRHRGFIPWDDDIDVAMPRPDYERFVELSGKVLAAPFSWTSPAANDAYPALFGKLLRDDTVLVEATTAALPIRHSVYVDVFPLDGVPRSGLARAVHQFLIYASRVRLSAGMLRPRRTRLFVPLLLMVPRRAVLALMARMAAAFPYDQSVDVVCTGGPYGYERQKWPRSWFGAGLMQEFEGLRVIGPMQWDDYLTQLYGDYMQLPPEGERNSHHGLIEFSDGTGLDAPLTS